MSLITWNPLDKGASTSLSNNNYTYQASVSSWSGTWARSSSFKTQGNWYWEFDIDAKVSNTNWLFGIANESEFYSINGAVNSNYLVVYFSGGNPSNARWYSFSSSSNISIGKELTTGDIVGFSLDVVGKVLKCYLNGVLLLTATDIPTGNISPIIWTSSINNIATANFGATAFTYEMPSNYLPYDLENASWLLIIKHLIKSNNNILTLQNNQFINVPNTSKESFETYGLDTLTSLVTPSIKSNYTMSEDRTEGDGKIFSQTIIPAKWQSLIQGIKSI